jgi:hypothetical protein
MDGVSIIDFQYGKVHESKAWPVIGFEASPMDLELLGTRLRDLGISHEDVTSQEDVEFRIIHYEPHLFRNPYFFKLEFPERPGALHDFLAIFRGSANLLLQLLLYRRASRSRHDGLRVRRRGRSQRVQKNAQRIEA